MENARRKKVTAMCKSIGDEYACFGFHPFLVHIYVSVCFKHNWNNYLRERLFHILLYYLMFDYKRVQTLQII